MLGTFVVDGVQEGGNRVELIDHCIVEIFLHSKCHLFFICFPACFRSDHCRRSSTDTGAAEDTFVETGPEC